MKDFILYVSMYSHLLPIIFGFILFKKLDDYLKILLSIIVFHQLFELATNYFATEFKTNVILVPYFNFFDLLAFTGILILRIFHRIKLLLYGFILTLFLIILPIDYYFVNQNQIVLSVFSSIYASLALLVLVLILFYKFLVNIDINGITSKPDFWIGAGILFYSCFNLLFYLYFQHFVIFDKSFALISINLKNMGNIISNILFTLAFVSNKKKLS